jgi:ADP-heptose:LPS heptosyltransferase
MGDVLLAGPAVRAVAAGADRVTLLCGPRGRAAGELLPGVDRVVEFRTPWIDPEPPPVCGPAVLALVRRLAGVGADAAVILTSFHQSALPLALLLRMAGVPFVAAISDDYPGSLLDVRHLVPDTVHEVERNLAVAAAAGFPAPPGDDRRLAIRRPPRPAGALCDGRYVVVHPGASVPARAWAAERHAQLVAALIDHGHRVVVTGSDEERALTAAVAGARSGVVDLGGKLGVAALAELLAGADVVVAANTGPAHLAAAVGTPVVSLFAPTVPAERWRPWGVPHIVLGAQDIGCAGCGARACPVGGHPCLDPVDVTEVVAAVERLGREVMVA